MIFMIFPMITRRMDESNHRKEKSPILKHQRPGIIEINAVWFAIRDEQNTVRLMVATDRVRE